MENIKNQEETRREGFNNLYALNVNDRTEKKNGLTYLTWAVAWAEFKKQYPSATYRIVRIPSEICKELLDTDLRGEQFQSPYSIPNNILEQEAHIRELIETKARVDEELGQIKSRILSEMESRNVKSWLGDTIKFTRKLPSTRTSSNLSLFKADHPDMDYEPYMNTTQVSSSLTIAV